MDEADNQSSSMSHPPDSPGTRDIPQSVAVGEAVAVAVGGENTEKGEKKGTLNDTKIGGELVLQEKHLSEDKIMISANEETKTTATNTPKSTKNDPETLSATKMNLTTTATATATATAAISSNKTPQSKTKSTTASSSSASKKIPSYLLKSSNGKATYASMIHEAIVEIGDRTGSSVPALQKFMKQKYEYLQRIEKKKFSTSFYNALKLGLKEERFVKIRNSYKMNREWVNKQKAAQKAKEVKKKNAEKKRKKEVEKARIEREKKKKEEKEKKEKLEKQEKAQKALLAAALAKKEDIVNDENKKREKAENERKKAEADAKARKLAERIRKRKFPMDDIALIAEDKELGVKRPSDVGKQPYLPFTMSALMPFDERPTTKKTTSCAIVNSCSATMSHGSRSTISDLLQLFHFFRGDVGYDRMFSSTIPAFQLKHLLYVVNEVMIGNAKKSQLVPPLISQLFYTSLKILTDPNEDDWNGVSDNEEEKMKWMPLKRDLVKLGSTLDEASWGQTLMCYLDLMDRFYSSDATIDPNALPGFPITLAVDDGSTDDEKMSEVTDNVEGSSDDGKTAFVDGYHGYIGPADGAINRGFVKLLRYDPWYLTAEEMMAILRALTDDILAMKADLAQKFVKRDEESLELLRAKKAAESYFRKIRLAYEGPKWPSKAKVKKPTTEEGKSENKSVEGAENSNGTSTENNLPKFKPTATKKEFEAAEKSRMKAIEQYEKGMKKLITRTEPIGYDRNHNAFYHFHHDPEMIHIEVNKNSQDQIWQTKSWHCIDHKPLFDDLVSSLDVRGVRESALYEEMIGNGGVSIKRYLSDSSKKNSLLLARKREEEDFERKLNNALVASENQARRSGRLANSAKDEVSKIRKEMELAKKAFEKQLEIEKNGPDYRTSTGIDIITEFESSKNVHTCFSKFCQENSKTSGIVGVITSKMLDLENYCEELDLWDRKDLPRAAWISNIGDITQSYERGNYIVLGPKAKCSNDDITPSKRQRRSLEPTPSPNTLATCSSLAQVVSALKEPLLDLEKRVYSIIGLERAVLEADDANDNVSVGSNDEETSQEQKALEKEERIQLAWKKKISSLYYIPTKRASAIREVLIDAIKIARKGKLEEVLHDLRQALNLHRPSAAGRARQMAFSVLEKYGGYVADGDMDESPDDDIEFTDPDVEEEDDDSKNISYLCGESMMLMGCLEGDSNADRVDWKDAVTGCKTITRFAALVATLESRASPKLLKLYEDREIFKKAIKYWEMGTKTRKSRSQKKSKDKYHSATEIWTSTDQTDEFVLGKVEGFPWWPARVCVAKNSGSTASLNSLDRALISFIGEQHLHVVKREGEIRPFTGTEQEDENIGDYPVDIVKNLRESTAMARRILRGKKDSVSNNEEEFAEEKKSSI